MLDIHANKIIANKFVGEFENNNDGISIGMIIPFASNKEIPSGFLLCNGASVRKDTYIDLFNIIGTIYGSIDEDHFNLPNLNGRFLEGDDTSGEYKEAGLPNITGKIEIARRNRDLYTQGAFASSDSSAGGYAPSSDRDSAYYSFDASRSNSIYGNSTTVQPNSLTIRYIIKAFNGFSASTTNFLEITQLANEINDKTNRSLNDLNEIGRKAFFPSNTYIDITNFFKNTSSEYIAPANGFISVRIASSTTEHGAIWVQTKGVAVGNSNHMLKGSNGCCCIPIAKGMTAVNKSTAGGTITCQFIYAENEI